MSSCDAVVEMVRCQDCGHIVPATNLTIHQIRGCREARRRSSESEPFVSRTEHVETMDTDEEEDERKMEAETTAGQNSTSDIQEIPHISASGRNSSNPIPVPESTPPRNQERNFVDLVDDDDEIEEIWPCPNCTFHNSLSNRVCEVCSVMRPLMHEPMRQERNNADSPIRLMSSGALLGSLVGGAAAYMRGRPMSSGMIQGALSGAVGGAFANELLRSESLRETPESDPRFAHMVRRQGRNGTSVASAQRRNTDPVVDQLLQMILAGNATRQMNIDGMNYEQLLERFGDGTENRGANESDIRSLPTSTITNESSLPNDHSDCMVCLESFKVGDERKTLPCLHGFHSACVDKWLRTSASCPVCKYSIRS